MENVKVEITSPVEEASPEKKKRKGDSRGGKRPGAGRPSRKIENEKRAEQGLPPLAAPINKKATLPQSKKQRSQEILAEMLGRKSKYIVQKVLDKALDDDDQDQMACLKLVMDRVLPQDYIQKMKGRSNQISIQIMGVGETTINASEEEDVIDGEIVEENE